jgi:general secretion pathway protein K
MAMLITLSVIAILFVVVLQVSRGSRSAALASGMTRDRFRLAEAARGGIHGAMALLIRDRETSETDTLQEDWANPEKLAQLGRELAGDDGLMEIAIGDEMGKIKVNALIKHPDLHAEDERQMLLMERLVAVLKEWNPSLAEVEAQAVVQAMKDWLDSGDGDAITGLNGAEAGYYAALDPPYACRNGPMVDLSDLLLIKGMQPALYAGAEDLPGLVHTLTVFGAKKGGGVRPAVEGRININTAPEAVLAALLPEEQRDLAPEIAAYREARNEAGFEHELSGPNWYRDVPGGSELTIAPQLIVTASDIFRIAACARSDETQVTATAVVQREKEGRTGRWRCHILSWRME